MAGMVNFLGVSHHFAVYPTSVTNARGLMKQVYHALSEEWSPARELPAVPT